MILAWIAPLVLAKPSDARAGTGDIYISGDSAGAAVLLDGIDAGVVSPGMLRDVAPGSHHVALIRGCGRQEVVVEVEVNAITRVELNVEDGRGTLDLTGAPPGALVQIDGAGVGELPWSGEIGCGSRALDVAAPGFVPFSRIVDIPAGDVLTLKVELLLEPRGALTLDVLPTDAALRVDGADSGVGPRTLHDVLPGLHTVEAARDGYWPAHTTVDLAAGAVERVALVLEPRREVPIARRVVGGTVAAGGLALATWSTLEFFSAHDAYGRFLAEPEDDTADALYATEVQPHQVNAWLAAGVGVAALATGGALFFIPSPDGAALGASGTF